tara:strand:+ start:1558 stop:1827 length:270 start_codon:yes stop_codon:yes gene_type:complete
MNISSVSPPLKRRKIEIEDCPIDNTKINYICYLCFVEFYCWEDCLNHCLVFQHDNSPGVLVDIHATTPAGRFFTLHQLCAIPPSPQTEK